MTETKDQLVEALRFYADPEIYKPHPHGPAFDRRDLSFRAREALAAHDAQRAESGAGVASWPQLRDRAQKAVEGKVLFKRFVDGTPLENDIACWMADFAISQLAAAPEKDHGG